MIMAVVTADQSRYDGVGSAKLLSMFVDNLKDHVMGGQK
jgi:hypothetical protein